IAPPTMASNSRNMSHIAASTIASMALLTSPLTSPTHSDPTRSNMPRTARDAAAAMSANTSTFTLTNAYARDLYAGSHPNSVTNLGMASPILSVSSYENTLSIVDRVVDTMSGDVQILRGFGNLANLENVKPGMNLDELENQLINGGFVESRSNPQ